MKGVNKSKSLKDDNLKDLVEEFRRFNKLFSLFLTKDDKNFTEDEKILALEMVGFTQNEIGKYLGITQQAVSLRIKKLKG